MKTPEMRKEISEVIWNTNKPGGWSKYKDISENNMDFEHIIENSEQMSSNEMMEKIEKVSTKLRFQCFGKVKNTRRLECDKELDNLYKEKIESQSDVEANLVESKIADALLKRQREEYEKKLQYLKDIKKEKGKSTAIFKLKEKVLGSKKEGSESVSMNDPETGEMICDPEELKKASIKYLSNLLENREPKEDYRQDLKTLELLHQYRMEEETNPQEELTEKDFHQMLKKLRKKKAEKYKFTLNGGKSYRNVLFCLYKKVWMTEKKPKSWEKTSCNMLYKSKGCKSDFENQRFIHSKDEIPKAFDIEF